MKMKFFFLLTLIFFSFVLQAQTVDSFRIRLLYKEKSLSILTGLSSGQYVFAEIGLSKITSGSDGHHPFMSGYFISNEIKLSDRTVVGPKVGVWAAGGMSGIAMGVNVIYYTDFKNGSLTFRPEVGIGMDLFKIVYGYNLQLTNKSFDRINTNLVSLVCFFKLKKKRSI